MRLLPAVIACCLMATPALADHYELDREHTNVLFFVSHVGFSEMVGRFGKLDGTFDFNPEKPEESKIDVTLNPESIQTSSDTLDKELQGDKFFNVAKFPEIRFVAKKVKVTAAGGSGVEAHDQADVTGNLTMLGVTKPVTLHVSYNKSDYHPITQKYVSGFSATGTLKRSDFGMGYLIPMVGDEVRLEIQVEGLSTDASKQQRIKH